MFEPARALAPEKASVVAGAMTPYAPLRGMTLWVFVVLAYFCLFNVYSLVCIPALVLHACLCV